MTDLRRGLSEVSFIGQNSFDMWRPPDMTEEDRCFVDNSFMGQNLLEILVSASNKGLSPFRFLINVTPKLSETRLGGSSPSIEKNNG